MADKGVHAFRRAAAAQMKRLGMQDSDILEVKGWKDITMLRRYTHSSAYAQPPQQGRNRTCDQSVMSLGIVPGS